MDLISQDAIDLIIAEEVSSKAAYEHSMRHPTWPEYASGITIGIGYDVGYVSANELQKDWQGHIPQNMIDALKPACGHTGEEARRLLRSIHGVDVPWEAAIAVFEGVDIPRWYNTCKSKLDHFEELPLDCKGALVSLAYNRGASFRMPGPRFVEMRNIAHEMARREFDLIPGEFRSMKRLWEGRKLQGLINRREHEAKLFERGLKEIAEA